MFKCSVNGCESEEVKLYKTAGVRFFTCGEGHFITTDYTRELETLTQAITILSAHTQNIPRNLSTVIDGISQTIKNDGIALRKEIKDELKKYLPIKK